MDHVGSKTRSLDQILEKTLCTLYRPHLMKSRTSSKMGHVGSTTRSLGQILEKEALLCRVKTRS